MKKTVIFLVFFFSTLNINSQSGKIKGYLDDINACVTAMDKSLESPNWQDDKYTRDFKGQSDKMYSKIRNIANEDSKYDISELENKLAFYKKKYAEGREMAEQEAIKKQNIAQSAKYLVKDEGLTNKVHEKYAGKIVFSSSDISAANPNESSFGSTFNITSDIYFRIYLKQSVYNILVAQGQNPDRLERDGSFRCKIYLDGKEIHSKLLNISDKTHTYIKPEEKKTKTSFAGSLNLKEEGLGSWNYINALLQSEALLTPGKHIVKIELYPQQQYDSKLPTELGASGEFELVVTKNFADPSNYVICMPVSKKKDPALEVKCLAAVKQYMTENKIKQEIKKFVFRAADWEITRNEYTNAILSRSIYGAIGVINEEGKCQFRVYEFTQQYVKGSFQPKITAHETSGYGEIFCDCLR